jgi:catechol 2,3-dioxygenase-like lactoylglutathione lyase family enzyme
MTISHVQLLSLPVADPDRALRFYAGVRGFDVGHDVEMPVGRWLQVRPTGAQTSVTLVTWFDSMPPGTLRGLVLESDDLDRDVEELGRRGVTFADGIRKEPWGRYATFADPDGNGLTLQSTAV